MRGSTQSDFTRLEHIQGYEFLREDLKKSIATYAARQDQLSAEVREEHSETRAHIDTGLRHTQQSVEAHISAEVGQIPVTAALASQREQLLNSLRYSSMNERRNHVSDSHEDTFHWVLRTEEEADESVEEDDWSVDEDDQRPDIPDFVGWLESEQQRFWVSGKPGSGKSTLMKFIIKHPRTLAALQRWRPESVILSHYFWKPGGGLQCSIKGLWCTLAYQCLSNDPALIDYVLSRLPTLRENREPSDWSVKAIEEMCLAALAQSSKPFCIFIDGLDEIDDREGVPALKAAVSKLLGRLGSKLKLCLASRSEPEIRRWLWDWPELRLHQLTHRDVQALVDAKLGDCYPNVDGTDTEERQTLVSHLKKMLVDKAEGVFIWLVLALQSVVRGFEAGDSLDELLARVNQMPSDIDDLYEDMWARIEPVYRQKATLLLRYATAIPDIYSCDWLICFTMATACDESDEIFRPGARVGSARLEELKQQCFRTQHDIETRCGGLLEVTNFVDVADSAYFKRVTFVHRTAYDHLMTSLSGRLILAYDEAVWMDTYSKALRSICALRSSWQLLGEVEGVSYQFRPHYAAFHELLEDLGQTCGNECLFRLIRMVVDMEANAEQSFHETVLATPKETAAAILGYLVTRKAVLPKLSISDPIFQSVLIEGLGLDTPTIASSALRHVFLDAAPIDDQVMSTAMNLLRLGADAIEPGLVLTNRIVYQPVGYDETLSGCALELLLQSRLSKPGSLTRSREDISLSIDLFDAMVVSERSLAKRTIIGLSDERPTLLIQPQDLQWFLSDASRPITNISYQVQVYPIFRGTLSHLLYPILFQQEFPEPDASAIERLQKIYNNSKQEPARLIGILAICSPPGERSVTYGYTLAAPDEMFSPHLLGASEMWQDSSCATGEAEYYPHFDRLKEEVGESERRSRIWNFIQEAVKKGVLVPNKREIDAFKLFAENYVASEHEQCL